MAYPLIGAADLVVRVEGQGGARAAYIDDVKDGPSGYSLGFTLDLFDLLPDAKGKPRSTCIAVEATPPIMEGRGKVRMNDEAVALLRDIESALASGEGRECSPEPEMPVCPTLNRRTWKARLIRSSWLQLPDKFPVLESEMGSIPDSEHKRLHKRLTTLKAKGLIGFNRADVWLTKPGLA